MLAIESYDLIAGTQPGDRRGTVAQHIVNDGGEAEFIRICRIAFRSYHCFLMKGSRIAVYPSRRAGIYRILCPCCDNPPLDAVSLKDS